MGRIGYFHRRYLRCLEIINEQAKFKVRPKTNPNLVDVKRLEEEDRQRIEEKQKIRI